MIPVQNEAMALPDTLAELSAALPENCRIAVGLNACTDDSRAVCEQFPVLIGETRQSGYGFGCQSAIDAAEDAGLIPDAYLFFAADGAHVPGDLLRLIAVFENRSNDGFIIGLRKFRLSSWVANFGRALPNLILGTWCRLLGGQFFYDLGPLRLIERTLFQKMNLREMVWGWTIEAQIRAARFGVNIVTVPVEERPRKAGEQKISGVSPWRSLRIGLSIGAAAWRSRFSTVS